jgi:hypothetical protein
MLERMRAADPHGSGRLDEDWTLEDLQNDFEAAASLGDFFHTVSSPRALRYFAVFGVILLIGIAVYALVRQGYAITTIIRYFAYGLAAFLGALLLAGITAVLYYGRIDARNERTATRVREYFERLRSDSPL